MATSDSVFVLGAHGPEAAWWPDHATDGTTIRAQRGAVIAGALVERAPSRARPASPTFVPVLRADGEIVFARALWSDDVPAVSASPDLFVYGSLRPGRAAADRLRPYTRHHELAQVRGTLLDLGDYPGWVPHGEGVVRGELVRVTELADALVELDAYEDFCGYTPAALERSLYHRVLARVTIADGQETWAWAYAWNGHGEHPSVVGGSWDR